MLDFIEVIGMLLGHQKLYANLSAVIFGLCFGNFSVFPTVLTSGPRRITWANGVGSFSMYLTTNAIKRSQHTLNTSNINYLDEKLLQILLKLQMYTHAV